MAGKWRSIRAKHEAAHAVIARKFGLSVTSVDVRVDAPHAASASAAWAAGSDVAAQIRGREQDAMVALAGHAATRRDYPDLRVLDLLHEHDDGDTLVACSAIYRMVCLMSGHTAPVSIDKAMEAQMYEIYLRLLRDTAALVEQLWPAIERVAKHLERHGRINDQRQLDELIERALR
jgi:hypothetical protein